MYCKLKYTCTGIVAEMVNAMSLVHFDVQGLGERVQGLG